MNGARMTIQTSSIDNILGSTILSLDEYQRLLSVEKAYNDLLAIIDQSGNENNGNVQILRIEYVRLESTHVRVNTPPFRRNISVVTNDNFTKKVNSALLQEVYDIESSFKTLYDAYQDCIDKNDKLVDIIERITNSWFFRLFHNQINIDNNELHEATM